jgi:polysaccharide deacetylase 2 family uncharacterized protein YibQ
MRKDIRHNRRKKNRNLWIIPVAIGVLLAAYFLRNYLGQPRMTKTIVLVNQGKTESQPKNIPGMMDILKRMGYTVKEVTTDLGQGLNYRIYIPNGHPLVRANMDISRLAREAGLETVSSMEDKKKQRLTLCYVSKDSVSLFISVQKRAADDEPQSPRPQIALVLYQWPPEKNELARQLLQVKQVNTLITKSKYSNRSKEIFCTLLLEPKGYPADDPGPKTILVDDPAGKIKNKLGQSSDFCDIPAGLFISYGSRAVEDKRIADRVTAYCAKNGLILIEPYPTARSLIKIAAKANSCSYQSPALIIDAEASSNSCAELLRKEINKTKGKTMIIVPATENTLTALKKVLGKEIINQYTFVSVSEMIK